MSRQVDHTAGPLSDEDKAYLNSRGRRHLILQNERMFAEDGEGAPEAEEDLSWEEYVSLMTVDELKSELAERELPHSGNKAELQKRLIEAGPDDES